ncbi:MAG: M6 family metalloprotease domain-containing protein, partial [Candidatus Latescibacterota bacterium]
RINPEAARAIIREARLYAQQADLQFLAGKGLTPQRVEPPCNGDVKGICLIVDFADEVATIAASEIDDYCNQQGYTGYGNNGSVRDYFYDVSDGNLTYTNYVPTAYYRAQYDKTYYDDCAASYGQRARELVLEALIELENNGFDFSQYDSNGDGLIDAINCFYAGVTDCGWAEGLWPHSWTVDFEADGVSAYRYQITGIGGSLRLSTFCHENGHMICYWPDLYDYDVGVDDSRGVGRFCIMCAYTSGTNPQEPCAYLKEIAGWATPTLLTTPQTLITVPASNTNTMFKYEHSSLTNEYYLFENRQQTGRDAGLPDAGLAIWHIDTEGNNSNNEMTPESHYLVTLVQADGNWDLENDVNYGDITDLWSDPGYIDCSPYTNPNTHWWDGSPSGLFAADISASGPTMTFVFNPICDIVPSSLDFSPAAVGETLDRTFTIMNFGVDPAVGTVTEPCSLYSIVSGQNYNIPPGGTHDVTVRFAPATPGLFDCTIQSGSTYCGDVLCTGDAFIRECIVEPDTLDFGEVQVGGAGSLTFKIRNDSDELLTGTLSESCDRYLITSSTYYVLNPGDSTTVTVLFIPTALGTETCMIDTGFELCKDVFCIGIGADLTPPPAPTGLTVTYNGGAGNWLGWDSSPASDFGSFKVYRSDNPDLTLDSPADTTWQEVYETPDTSWADTAPDGWRYRYCVTTLDTGDNESGPAFPSVVTGISDTAVPLAFSLHRSAPNPFNPSTVITYDVPPGGGKVTIKVYDVTGRLVKTLVDEHKGTGRQTVKWFGNNERGEQVATGVYFCSMEAPGYQKTMKMTLLK